MNNPLISVIMSVFNEDLRFLQSSLNSVVNQTYPNIEFIIVNDSPNNFQISGILKFYQRKYSKITIIKNETNLGLSKSLNKAIRAANGEYLARMDSDDISFEDRLEKQLNFLCANNYDLVGSYIEKIDMNNISLGISFIPTTERQIKALLPYATISFHPTWFGKKEVFDNIMYNELFTSAQDYEFITRAIFNEYKIGNINEVLLKYRINDNALSRRKAYIQFKLHQFVAKRVRDKSFDVNGSVNCFLLNVDKKKQEKYNRANIAFIKLAQKKTIFNTLVVLKNILFIQDFRKRFINFIISKLILKYV